MHGNRPSLCGNVSLVSASSIDIKHLNPGFGGEVDSSSVLRQYKVDGQRAEPRLPDHRLVGTAGRPKALNERAGGRANGRGMMMYLRYTHHVAMHVCNLLLRVSDIYILLCIIY